MIPSEFLDDYGYLANYDGYAASLGVRSFHDGRINAAFEARLCDELPFIVDADEGTLGLWHQPNPVAERLSDIWFVYWLGRINGRGRVRYMFAQEGDAIIARFHVQGST